MATTVYFDLDGTLLDYEVPFKSALRGRFRSTRPMRWSKRTRIACLGITQIKSDPFERAFSAVCERYSLDADPETFAAEVRRSRSRSDPSRPAVRRLVESLAKRHQFGVLTNGDGYMQRRKLEEHGLDDLADAVVISNEVGVRKPNPQIFETARGGSRRSRTSTWATPSRRISRPHGKRGSRRWAGCFCGLSSVSKRLY